MTNAPQQVAFEPTPLVAPVDRAAVRDWQRAQASKPTFSFSTILTLGFLLVPALVFLWVFIGIAQIAVRSFNGGAVSLGWPLIATLLAGVGALMVLLTVGFRRTKRTRGYRLDHFARANHMQYMPRRADPPLPGMIFALGRHRTSLDLVRGEHPRFVEFANYRYD